MMTKLTTIKNILKTHVAGGKFFSAIFIKKDGSKRKMTCRLGVTKYLKGGSNGLDKYENLVTVYDLKSKGYRCINLETVFEIKAAGNTFQFNS